METAAKKIHDNLMDIICQELYSREVKLYKLRLRNDDYGGFRPREVESMDSMEDILAAQERRGIFTIGDYSKLKEQLKNIKHCYLVDVVGEHEEKLRNLGAAVKKESMDAEPLPSPGYKDPADCYSHAGKGYVLYISIFVKENDHTGRPREGVQVDKQNIRRFFTAREFQIKFSEDIRTPEELWKTIEDVKKEAEIENSSSFFFIISSHGKGITLKNKTGGVEFHKDTENPVVISEEIRLVERNAYVRVDEIVSKFEHFMSGKPKVLIFQACRNLPELPRVRDRADDDSSQVDFDDAVRYYSAIIPGNADMVVVHDTSRGSKSYRNNKDGAWLFNDLFVQLNDRFEREHLLDVLTRLNNLISKRERNDGKTGLQMSCFISTLTKFFYLTNH